MTRSKKRMLSVLFCMALSLIMCLAFSAGAYAADTPQVLSNGSSVTPKSVNSVKSASNVAVYATPKTASTISEKFTYNINAKKGTLFIFYSPANGASCYINDVTGASVAGSGTSDSVDYRTYYVPSTGTVKVTFTVYGAAGGQGVFSACYAPASKTVKSGKTALLGSPGSGSNSSVKIKVPSNGYLKVTAHDAMNSSYSVYMNTKGFKDWQYLYSSNDHTEYIGVKKGTYTLKFKGASLYNVKVQFTKVKETSAKTSKASAAKITKNKVNKGIIAVNKKKVHWYKIKNPKNQAMKLYVNTKKMSDGGSYGGIKMTIYYPNKSSRYTTVSPGQSGPIEIYYGTVGTKKARAGTYYVKIETNSGGNGYYTLKWK